ncbi:hypothetical protein BKA69DRAFT_1026877 [Paraphysoderma sedebokerense]|nr:hypothetical protein BKA69DRAFT_1026877 [Paraphysoderma sedebokerense]
MVSDFFFPNMGGVESHLYHLSQKLIKLGHKVIIITHHYNHRTGVRWLPNGLKVYYLPQVIVYQQSSFPTIYGIFPLFRNIVIREEIDIVHGHGAFSSLCHESILHARTMGLKTCFTDHSLFGFADVSSILTNKLLKFTLSDVDHVICVSHTSKENTVLRASLNPNLVSVIPNAVIAAQFKPDPSSADPSKITVAVISRLVYRKGMDLLVALIPKMCAMYSNIHFIIAGDGNKSIDLEQMREKFMLQDRVELLGAVKHHEVRNVLIQAQIFLNTSLTEAFCIGIVEAACCGLLVVSTKVGGVPEVLPSHMIEFAKTEVEDLIVALGRAIRKVESGKIDPFKFHETIANLYSWVDVAERTEQVYMNIISKPQLPLIERLRRYYGCGLWAGKMFCFVVALDYLLFVFLEFLWRREKIEKPRKFDLEKYKKVC